MLFGFITRFIMRSRFKYVFTYNICFFYYLTFSKLSPTFRSMYICPINIYAKPIYCDMCCDYSLC